MKKILLFILLFQSVGAKADFNSALTEYENENYEAAFNEFLNLAKIGEKRSQFNLGVMYYQGQFVTNDVNKAYAWTRLAIEQENASEQEKTIHDLILAKVKDKQAADAEYASLAANYASPILLERLYPVLITNEDLSSFDAKPIAIIPPKYPHKAISRGVMGYVTFKFDLDKSGNPRNIRILEAAPLNVFEKEALYAISKWRFEPAKNDVDESVKAFDLTYKIEFKIAGKENIIDEDKYFSMKKAAMSGDPQAQMTIGFWHSRFDNWPEKENPTEWLFKAAVQGNAFAQYEVGQSLINGKGCIVDKVKGIEWLTRAASSGQPDAMNLLAGLATNESTLEAQKQALYYLANIENLSASAIIRLSWLLSTSPYPEIAEPKKAISLIENIKWGVYKDEVTKQEILAAAYAALGDFKKAVDYQEEALDDAEDFDFDVTEIKQHLALYKQNKKWF